MKKNGYLHRKIRQWKMPLDCSWSVPSFKRRQRESGAEKRGGGRVREDQSREGDRVRERDAEGEDAGAGTSQQD